MTELRIETSKPAPSPVINAWLNPSPKGFELVLKHSGDTQEQRLFFFDLRDGTIGVSVQGLFAVNLCKAFGIERGATPTILPWGSHLAPSEADKLPSGVAEALGQERDWADELADAIWPHSAGPRNISVPVIANIIRKSRSRPIGNDTVTGLVFKLDVAAKVFDTVHTPDAQDAMFNAGHAKLLRDTIAALKATQ